MERGRLPWVREVRPELARKPGRARWGENSENSPFPSVNLGIVRVVKLSSPCFHVLGSSITFC